MRRKEMSAGSPVDVWIFDEHSEYAPPIQQHMPAMVIQGWVNFQTFGDDQYQRADFHHTTLVWAHK